MIKRKINRGKSRHNRLQASLCKSTTKRCFISSLSRTLIQLNNDSHDIKEYQIYSEVPFPGMKIAKSSRADLVFYIPKKMIIIHEYKTTELKKTPEYLKQIYFDQLNRCVDNFLRVVNVAARQKRFQDCDVNGGAKIKLYKLLTIRNYFDRKNITDQTEIVGERFMYIPNLKYGMLVKALHNKSLFNY